MILEGFEIENWSCIQHLAVADLPPSAVIVLHGPNGTGKSSIVEALRACLMDRKSTSKVIGRGLSRNTTEKPRVSVTFRAAGISWRITKQFNSKDSKLESQTATGQWKLETADPSEAHERTRQLTGGSDSTLGLQQLLWLTQAEFHLPDPKKFDADVQSKLRAVLGVLQTPLDDRFLAKVKAEWSRWFRFPRKPGEKPKLKKDCPLDKALAVLEQHKTELAEIEREYRGFERMLERSGSLEILTLNLRRQLMGKTEAVRVLQQEYETSLKRLEAHRLAVERVNGAEKALAEAQALRQRRADAEQRIREVCSSAEAASRDVAEKGRLLQLAEQQLRELRLEWQRLRDTGRDLQDRLNRVGERRQLLALKEQVKNAHENLVRAKQLAGELDELKKQARDRPAPDPECLRKLEDNRTKVGQARADLEAAALGITLVPQAGAAKPSLVIDGVKEPGGEQRADETPRHYLVRRRAEIAIPGWGSIELKRGSDVRSLEQIENDLSELDRKFSEWLAPFGVAAADPSALDQLRDRAAEKKVRDPEIVRKQTEINRLAPKGLDAVREEVARLEQLLLASASSSPLPATEDLPAAPHELEQLDRQLKNAISTNEKNMHDAELQIKTVEHAIDGGLRQQEASARDQLGTLNATVKLHRDELERMVTSEQLAQTLRDAAEAVSKARTELDQARLTENEETIRARLDAARTGLHALEEQLEAAKKEFHQIEGAMGQSEGLHQRRAAAAARVEELQLVTDRDTLQSEAFDRLCALFEECREKQLGAVMGPIHDRVLRWMRLLRIGDYDAIRFNDQFLPELLMGGGGASEMTLDDESTGTIEQVALMVRLALGSMLSSVEEPVVALLDDPLTHSDAVRLDMMRAVLKNASAGDTGSTPPAGPLQIVVLTCHPEWFAVDGAKVVDLSNPDVLRRWPR